MQVQDNYPLSSRLGYKIGGKAKYFIEVSSPDDIPTLLEFLEKEHHDDVFVCGLGSNLVFRDEDFDGAVIAIAAPNETKPISVTVDGKLTVFAGDTLDTAIQFAFDNQFVGLEWAGGLPGTVGAGVRGNVGAFGGEIKDSLESVEVISLKEPEKGVHVLKRDDLHFAYRHSLIKEQPGLLVVSVTFGLQHASVDELVQAREVYEKNRQHRAKNHPLEYPNCGSVFKNIRKKDQIEKILSLYPELAENVEKKWHGKVAAASLIERLGFKGYRVGNAQVSEKHALFIINLGGAKARDVRQIINDIQGKFQQTFGFQLEVEVEIVR